MNLIPDNIKLVLAQIIDCSCSAMFYSPPRRKQNKAQSRKATEDNTSVPIDQTLSLEHANETATDSKMSETDVETQTSTNAEMNMIIYTGIPCGTGRGRGRISRTSTPNRPGSVLSGTDQDYSSLERKIELLTTGFDNMISQQNSLLERLLSSGMEKIEQVHISNRGDSPSRFPRGHRSEGGEFSSNVHGDKDYRDYPADGETNFDAVRDRRRHNLNFLPVNPSFDSGAFAHFSGGRDVTETSRLRPIVNLSTERNEMGSVERELRHVRFESDDTAFPPGIQNMDSRLRRDDNRSQEINANNFDSRSQKTVPRLIRIVVGEPNANGQIIDREIFVTEQRYREMTYDEGHRSRDTLNDRRSVGRGSVRSNEFRGSPLSGRNSSASTTRRTGSLFSWCGDDSSESDNPSRINPNQSYSLPSNRGSGRSYSGFDNDMPMKIGRIVSSWKVSFPKTERNP